MTECTEKQFGKLDLVIKDLKDRPIPDLEYQIHIAGKVVASGKTDSNGKGKTTKDLRIGSKFEVHVKRKQGEYKKVAHEILHSDSCTATLNSPKIHFPVTTDVDNPVHKVAEIKTEQPTEFPDSVIQEIKDEISFNAPIRSISVKIPWKRMKFGKDCITLLNAILRRLYHKPNMKLGSQVVGGPDSTHQILLKKGLAGPLKSFAFVTKEGKDTKVNSTADHLKESVGEYVKKNYGKKGVSVYGVGALGGYHSILLTYREKNGVSEFMLVDQGPATSFFTGKSIFTTENELDEALSEYVEARQGKRTDGDYEFPANVQLYKIYPSKK